MTRKALLREAMQKAADLRDHLDLDPFGPVDPYHAAEMLGVKVVFLGASMEGFYFKGPPPRILISGKRPVGRRAFTCAHELGHHIFNHGSTIDQLQEDDRSDAEKPEEIIANGFAASFLMPSVGLRGAFAKRGWKISTATPWQIYVVACQFGVGYRTLVSHLAFTLRDLPPPQREKLDRWTPQRIRTETIGEGYDALLAIDGASEGQTFDVEKGCVVLVPPGTKVSGRALIHERTEVEFELYRAARRGISSATGIDTPAEIRVMPNEYEGAASNRFLEDPDEE